MSVSKTSLLSRTLRVVMMVSGALLLIAAACNGNDHRDAITENTDESCIAGKDAPYDMDLTVAQSDSLINANRTNDCFVIMDVRTPDEYNQGHIEGAVLYDYNAGDLHDALDSLHKHRIYLVYCRSGNRSARAVEDMKEAGFTALYNMLAGFNDWTSAGLPSVE